MFDWLFKPYCPVDRSAKEWIERHLKWLSRQFPSNIFTDCRLVAQTEEFFPEPYEPSKDAAKSIICADLPFHVGPRRSCKPQIHERRSLSHTDVGWITPSSVPGTVEIRKSGFDAVPLHSLCRHHFLLH
jgi:hypothetical protein